MANNPVISLDANNNVLIAGGMTAGGTNKNEGENSTIAAGTGNTITTNGKNSTILGGQLNTISAANATIGAGLRNVISGE